MIRSGFSIAYNEPYSNLYTNASRLDPPEANTVLAEPVVGVGISAIPYTFPFQPDPDFAVGPPTANGGIPVPGLEITPNGVNPHLRTAYAMQWFLGDSALIRPRLWFHAQLCWDTRCGRLHPGRLQPF